MTEEETNKVCDLLFKNGHAMNAGFVARAPQVIADAAGITIPEGTRLLVGRSAFDNLCFFSCLCNVLSYSYLLEDSSVQCLCLPLAFSALFN